VEFFDYFNFTLPCQEECPLDYGIFHSCSMTAKEDEILLDFTLPKVDKSLVRVEADSFVLMKKNKTSTCKVKYMGPLFAILSVEEDCVYETLNEKPKNNLEHAILSKCKNSSALNSLDDYFRVESCKKPVEGDEKEFVQVKLFDNEYYIYCSGLSYHIGKRDIKCPAKVFTLPLSLTFILNDVEYKGDILTVIYRQREDPFSHGTPELASQSPRKLEQSHEGIGGGLGGRL